MKKILLLITLFVMICPCIAAQDAYTFPTEQQEQRFKSLTRELRCLVCQNQNIADSNAALAADLRDIIFQQIRQGESNQQIIHYLVARYGDFILYRPPMNIKTLGLWFGPFLLLFLSISYLLYYIYHNRRE